MSDPIEFSTIKIGGVSLPISGLRIDETREREPPIGNIMVTFTVETTFGAEAADSLFAFVHDAFPLPDSMDMRLTEDGCEPRTIRVLRDMQPYDIGGGRVCVPIYEVSGPRMVDGRWSPGEALP